MSVRTKQKRKPDRKSKIWAWGSHASKRGEGGGGDSVAEKSDHSAELINDPPLGKGAIASVRGEGDRTTQFFILQVPRRKGGPLGEILHIKGYLRVALNTRKAE